MRTLVRNIKSLVQVDDVHSTVSGARLAYLPTIENAFLLIEDGRIADYGPLSLAPESADDYIDAKGGYVLPTWCDSHTHLVYAGSRESEFVDRIKGLTYEEISAKGGGILNSAKRLQATSEEALFEQSLPRLHEIVSTGTGAVEVKSGYGLTLEAELKMLRVIRRLKEQSTVSIKATFLGAHSIPMEYRANREAYIDLIVNEMIPAVATGGLADYCDVFCEKGFFTVEESERILETGLKYGLKPKLHANQLSCSGAVQLGVNMKAVSVDHLEQMGDAEIAALKGSTTIPTLLPGSAFFLNNHYPPARQMIDAGLPICLATDMNPGTTPSGNMPITIALACINMKMLPEEAINAATINGAAAMELLESHGTISKGKVASFIITKPMPSLDFLPYAYGSNLIDRVYINGKMI
ncbi:MAG: imidazolonepropionase [Chitinophagales bacterium]|nr:imidazolonepropionase [Chitinophagales bacterium]